MAEIPMKQESQGVCVSSPTKDSPPAILFYSIGTRITACKREV